MLRLIPVLVALVGACGGSPPPAPPARLDVFENVYLRGTTGESLGLTFDGLGPCAADVLARLKAPGAGLAPLRATFFVAAEAELDAAVVARLQAEGHEAALRVPTIPPAWHSDPAEARRGLRAAEVDLRAALAEAGWQGSIPRFWRPGGAPDAATLGRAADVERPLVLWSAYGEGATPAEITARLGGRLVGGALVAIPTDAPGCPAVEVVASLARDLAERRLVAVPAGELLADALNRRQPLQAVRYHGLGLAPACAQALGRPGDPEGEAARWGLLYDVDARGARVLPLSGLAGATEALLGLDLTELLASRTRWATLPGCLRRVASGQILSPIAAGAGPQQWFAVGEAGLAERDARATGAPGRPAVLPAAIDLVRLEARQRLPWALRGVVADALARLGLDTPVLVEARAVPALLVARPLAPGASAAEIEAAVGGFLQVVELSLAEYLFLGAASPAELGQLQRMARAADGFLRPGPFVVLRGPSGPDGARLGPDGEGLPEPAAALVGRVLATGRSLAPGDVVSALPTVLGAPPIAEDAVQRSRRARLRHGLARSILVGTARPGYLRPGAVVRVDGDLLGVQEVRVAVPPGIAVPSLDSNPLRPAISPAGGP